MKVNPNLFASIDLGFSTYFRVLNPILSEGLVFSNRTLKDSPTLAQPAELTLLLVISYHPQIVFVSWLYGEDFVG